MWYKPKLTRMLVITIINFRGVLENFSYLLSVVFPKMTFYVRLDYKYPSESCNTTEDVFSDSRFCIFKFTRNSSSAPKVSNLEIRVEDGYLNSIESRRYKVMIPWPVLTEKQFVKRVAVQKLNQTYAAVCKISTVHDIPDIYQIDTTSPVDSMTAFYDGRYKKINITPKNTLVPPKVYLTQNFKLGAFVVHNENSFNLA